MASAAIPGGGWARRFGGRDKSALVIHGLPILDRQMSELSCRTDYIVILLVGRVDMRAPPPGVRLVPDRIPDSGPLGGLDAALVAERDEIRVLLACDMPFATSALLAYRVAEAQHADIVVPRTKRGYYPLCAVYTRTCRNAVAGRLDRRDFTMTGLFEDMRVRVMDSSDLERFSNTDRLLANVNTPVEFDELEALLGHKL